MPTQLTIHEPVSYNLIIQNKIDLKTYDLLLVYYFENIDSQEFSK
jgi:hypothetical protein